MKLILNFSSC